jgi:hypothetical protein
MSPVRQVPYRHRTTLGAGLALVDHHAATASGALIFSERAAAGAGAAGAALAAQRPPSLPSRCCGGRLGGRPYRQRKHILGFGCHSMPAGPALPLRYRYLRSQHTVDPQRKRSLVLLC